MSEYISSLEDLNNAINSVVNYLVAKACKETTDGTYVISLGEIDTKELEHPISWDDLYYYDQFVYSELFNRPELVDLDYSNNDFTLYCNPKYCPNLDGRSAVEKVLPISQSLSLSEQAKFSDNAIKHISDKFGDRRINALHQFLDMSFEQARRLNLTDKDYYFSVRTPGEDKSIYCSDIPSAIYQLQAESSLHPRTKIEMEYRFLTALGCEERIPVAAANRGVVVPILPATERQISLLEKDPVYANTLACAEAEVYGFDQYSSLHYTVDSPRGPGVHAVTLEDALQKFKSAEQEPGLAIHAVLNVPGSEPAFWTLLQQQAAGIAMTSEPPQENTWGHLGIYRIAEDVAMRVFPNKELSIDRWKVRFVAPGEYYGRENHLVNESTKPIVEFIDAKNASKEVPAGQSLPSYYLETLLAKRNTYFPNGLTLDADAPAWRVSSKEMNVILSWLDRKSFQLSQEKPASLDSTLKDAKERAATQTSGESLQPNKDVERGD